MSETIQWVIISCLMFWVCWAYWRIRALEDAVIDTGEVIGQLVIQLAGKEVKGNVVDSEREGE